MYSIKVWTNGLERLQGMLGTPQENTRLDSTDEGQEIKASGDAILMANAIHDLADAIRENTRAMSGEETDPDEPATRYLSGDPIA